MGDKFFVDTNILIYAYDRDSGPNHLPARELIEQLWRTGEGALSTQVLQEFSVNLQRKVARPLSPEKIRVVIEDYLSWEIVVNTPESVLQALEIQSLHQISFWDALIVQAAQACGASALYSEDLNSGQVYGAVRVLNPFSP